MAKLAVGSALLCELRLQLSRTMPKTSSLRNRGMEGIAEVMSELVREGCTEMRVVGVSQ
jgi:hypothetical protein